MLSRILPIAICALAVTAGCERSDDPRLVGSWRSHSEEMVGQIQFAPDHTFTSREWDTANSLSDAGDWHVSGSKLMLNFHGGTRAPDKRSVEFSLAMRDQDHLTLRQANGAVTILERLK